MGTLGQIFSAIFCIGINSCQLHCIVITLRCRGIPYSNIFIIHLSRHIIALCSNVVFSMYCRFSLHCLYYPLWGYLNAQLFCKPLKLNHDRYIFFYYFFSMTNWLSQIIHLLVLLSPDIYVYIYICCISPGVRVLCLESVRQS